MDKTYCSRIQCANLDCTRHQIYAPKSKDICIADLNDGWCFTPVTTARRNTTEREKLLLAICKGTQNTSYVCDVTCKALCSNDGTCDYCGRIADAVEAEFRKSGMRDN